MNRKGLRQRARRRARAMSDNEPEFLDRYGKELLALGVAGDDRLTPKPQWWRSGEAPNRWAS